MTIIDDSPEIEKIKTIINASDKELFLGSNNISDEGASYLGEFLKNNISFNDIYLGDNLISHIGAEYLANSMILNNSLTVLYLGDNKLGDEGAISIAEAIKQNTSLTVIFLGGNQIGDIGIKSIAESLKYNQSLTGMDINANKVSDLGAEYLAEALKFNHKLNGINLDDNQITDIGAKLLADGLKENDTLQEIYLGYNKISDLGAKYFSETFKISPKLSKIYLQCNQITDLGAKYFIEALKANPNIIEIYLLCNLMSAKYEKIIRDLINKNKNNLAKITEESVNDSESLQLTNNLDESNNVFSTNLCDSNVFKNSNSPKKDNNIENLVCKLDKLNVKQNNYNNNNNLFKTCSNINELIIEQQIKVEISEISPIVDSDSNYISFKDEDGRIFYMANFQGLEVMVEKLDNKNRDRIIEMLQILYNLKNAFLFKILGYAEDSDFIYVISTFTQVDFRLRLHKILFEYFSEIKVKYELILQITECIQNIHERKIVVRGIKNSNLYFTVNKANSEIKIYLNYFNLNDLIYEEKNGLELSLDNFDSYWIAPEFFKTGVLSLETDIYAFGILMWEIISGNNPYDFTIRSNDIKNELKFDAKNFFYDILIEPLSTINNLIISCIDHEPSNRPNIQQIHQILIEIILSLKS